MNAEEYARFNPRRGALILPIVNELTRMGWEESLYDLDEDAAYAGKEPPFRVLMNIGKGSNQQRSMFLAVRTEHPRYGQPVEDVFVDYVSVADPDHNWTTLGKGAADVHVHRNDPVATAVALALYTNEELVAEYNAKAREQRAREALNASAGDLLREFNQLSTR